MNYCAKHDQFYTDYCVYCKKEKRKIEDWEKEFDEKFCEGEYNQYWKDGGSYCCIQPPAIKIFIRKLLDKQRNYFRLIYRLRSKNKNVINKK